ncbi:hypothetical protein GCM10010911_46880 [Paenibacillus nasutitermitis]|uniref:Uncharacterized protein n=1 Tax=Paenibacillus nasutitermitis TaxID=1652958 RepID=A0A917E033_9BACL|nr:hypothetical protein GCM10010911_46880 [Paenibacillus nasutitermitis]
MITQSSNYRTSFGDYNSNADPEKMKELSERYAAMDEPQKEKQGGSNMWYI